MLLLRFLLFTAYKNNLPFWKRGRFTLEDTSHRSRTMITTLKDDVDDLTLGIINCHLEGNPIKSITRVKQIQKALSELSTKFTHHDLIICGDMNCQLGESASSAYLELGTYPKGQQIMDWGQDVDFSHVPSHQYNFHSVFPIDLVKTDPTKYITYVSSPYHYTVGLDQIWVHDALDAVKVIGLRSPFQSNEQKEHILASGLPSEFNPSDHLPVGCILEFDRVEKIDLRTLNNQMSAGIEGTNTEMKAADAMNLLLQYPFESEEERREFQFVLAPVPNLPEKGKPNKNQLRLLAKKRAKRQKLLEKVTSEKRESMKKIIKLFKQSTKK